MADPGLGMLISPQWKLANIQLVNWGSFDGYHSIDLAVDSPDGKPGITMITGASGSGKSALCDSNTQVLMPANARLKFNSASNKALSTKRGGERTVKTYVRGKVDTVHASDGTEKERFLRPGGTAQWSAIVYTYANATGEEYSIARFFYLKALDSDDVPKAFYVTAHAKIDPLLMNSQSARTFTQGVLKSVYPKATVHDGPTRFMDAVCSKLCIGGDAGSLNALKLLWRVQAGYPVDDVDSLYKELVIDKPRTFELAAKAVETFDENESVWQQLDLARRKLDVLEGIVDWHDQLEEAQEKVVLIEALGKSRRSKEDPFELGTPRDETPFGLWSQRRCLAMAQGEASRLTGKQQLLDAQLREVEAERAELAREETHVTALIAENGGARLDVIDNDIEQARAWVGERTSYRSQYAALAVALGEELPEEREAFDGMRERLRERAVAAQAEREAAQANRDEIVVRAAAVKSDLDRVEAELEYYREHKVNVTPAMVAARVVASEASGIPVEDLPFAAELIDVPDSEERWRDAVNIALHGLASTMLVDRRELDRFSRSIDAKKHEMGMRLNFIGVDLDRDYVSAARRGYISSKVIYKDESPFIGWVKGQVNDERTDYRCVEGPELLGGRESKITPSGQTRRGMRGAHGHGKHFRIIGFSNEQLIEQLCEQEKRLEAEQARLDALVGESDEAILKIDELMRVVSRFGELEWARIDIVSAQARLEELLDERKRLDTDERLRELREKRDALIAERDLKSQELGVVKNELSRCLEGLSRASALAGRASGRIDAMEGRGVVVAEEAGLWLDGAAADLADLYADNITEERVEDFLGRMAEAVKEQRARFVRDGKNARAALAKAFSTYHREFLESDPNFSIDPVKGYADYLGILEELLEKRLDEPEEAWTMRLLRQTAQSLVTLQEAFSAEVRTIKERLQPINEIMALYPFGPKAGVLSVVTEDRGNATIADFKRQLAKWSSYAFAGAPPASFQNEHKRLVRFMETVRSDLDVGSFLDARKLVDIKVVATWPDDPDREDSVFTKLGEKSGGETQELVAFILGGALLYYLGDNGDRLPSYSTVFLDEAFIKADAKFTRRAIEALRGLGFQIVIAIPEDKVESISPVADKFICVTKGADDRSHISMLDRVDRPVAS